MADSSDLAIFPKLVKGPIKTWIEALWKQQVTRQVVANFLILLI